MEISKYNFYINKKGKYYIYNSLINSLFEVDKESFIIIKKGIIKDIFSFFDDEDINNLIINKAITESNNEDFIELKKRIINLRKSDTVLNLTIAPTLDCNYRCEYCFENLKKKYINKNNIKSITNYINKQGIKKDVDITWYGGEPLLAIKEIKEILENLHIYSFNSYTSSIVTNGFLLNEEMIASLSSLLINNIQITLDGNEKYHNQIKYTKDCKNTFKTTIQNIDTFAKFIKNITLTLRINVSNKNNEDTINLINHLKEKYSIYKNIHIYMDFITSNQKTQNILNTSIIESNDKIKYIKKIYQQLEYVPVKESISYIETECSVRKNAFFTIGPDAEIYKCYETVGNSKYIIGYIKNGNIEITNSTLLNSYLYNNDPLNNNKCINCKYFPLCLGGCPQRINKDKYNKTKDCMFNQKRLLYYIKSIIP